MDLISIDVDKIKFRFILKDCFERIRNNRRLLLALKRLKYKVIDDDVLIPYETKTQISVLTEIQLLLNKFGYLKTLTDDTKKDVANFDREQKLFTEFSNKARTIRNNEFDNNLELVEEFNVFQKNLRKKLVRELYPLQLLSSFHMAFSQNTCNFSVPGAGKTTIVYGAYAYLKNLSDDNPRRVDKLLVIGPLSSFAPWEIEFEECFGEKTSFQRLSGESSISTEVKKQHLYSAKPAEVTLIFYMSVDSLQTEIIDFLKQHRTMVVVDEAHRIKNPDGVWGRSVIEIAKEARSRIVLTGTPVPNGYEDLYNLYQFIYPYKYKDILNFHYGNLVDMTQTNLPDSQRVKDFTNNISPFFIRIKKSDLDLPPVKEEIINVDMDQQQREIYDFIETKYIKSFRNNPSATVKDVLNKAKLIRLRQAAINPELLQKALKETLHRDDIESNFIQPSKVPEMYLEDSEILSKIINYPKYNTPRKFEEVYKLLSEKIIPYSEKVIIWSIFILNAKTLQNYLFHKNIKSELLIGEVEQVDRESVINKFNNSNNLDFQVVIANPFSVAESISLHKGCHNAIYLERDYNSSNFLQSKDRIHRVGLNKNQITNYYYLLSKNSIDGVINDRLNDKIKRMQKLIDNEIPLFTRISDNDDTDLIKALITDYAKRT